MRDHSHLAWRRLIGSLAVFAFAAFGQDSAAATMVANPQATPQMRMPAGARIRAIPRKASYFLGENILVDHQVMNTGEATFTVDSGGDYRGASRRLRFKVEAIDELGVKVEDPDPSGIHMGGLSSSPQIEPGEAFKATLPIMRYCRFEKPGVYKIRVAHDLGWSAKTNRDPDHWWGAIGRDDPRWAETSITLIMPDDSQARKVVEQAYGLPSDPDTVEGTKARDYADFSSFKFPVYLPILKQRASEGSGDERALLGVASIPTPDATAALIRFLEHPNRDFAYKAAQFLGYRLPDPLLQGKLPPANPLINYQISQRQWMVQSAWQSRYTDDVRAHAVKLLAGDTARKVGMGAFMLEAVGTKEDLSALIHALDKAIAATITLPFETGIYPRPRGSCQELLRAAQMLLSRGATPPVDAASPGQIAVFLLALHEDHLNRPKGYEAMCAAWVGHRIPFVRELALLNVPRPAPAAVLARTPSLLADKYPDVAIAPCKLIIDMKDRRFGEDLLRLMARAKDDMTISFAAQAAWVTALPLDLCLKVWARRLDETERIQTIFSQLLPVFDREVGGYGWNGKPSDAEARRLKSAWETFLSKYKDSIRQGKRFRLDDPAVAGLIPKQITLDK